MSRAVWSFLIALGAASSAFGAYPPLKGGSLTFTVFEQNPGNFQVFIDRHQGQGQPQDLEQVYISADIQSRILDPKFSVANLRSDLAALNAYLVNGHSLSEMPPSFKDSKIFVDFVATRLKEIKLDEKLQDPVLKSYVKNLRAINASLQEDVQKSQKNCPPPPARRFPVRPPAQ
jgi:hypothetical protein